MELRLPCQIRDVNANFGSFYGRMRPDEPSPTITTQPYNTGAGRFTHPSQDRGLTLREAAILQGFPEGLYLHRTGREDNPRKCWSPDRQCCATSLWTGCGQRNQSGCLAPVSLPDSFYLASTSFVKSESDASSMRYANRKL